MLDPTTRTTLLALARRYLEAPCCDPGTELARAVVGALDTPTSAHPGRVWRKGEKCPIVAEGQRRRDSGGAYTVGRGDEHGMFEIVTDTGRIRHFTWHHDIIALELLDADWPSEPIPLADILPRVEVTQ